MGKKDRIAQKEEASNSKKKAEDAKAAASEDAEWSKGAKGKGKGDDKTAAAAAAKARKEEAARLLAEEEASIKTVKTAPKAGAKKTPSAKTTPTVPSFADSTVEPASFSASGIDDALDMLTLVNERSDKAYVGAQANAKVDTHPERRFKAAFEAFKQAELPQMKKDYPGLRLQQYNERLYEAFKRHPDNPFNQLTLSYDSTKEDKVTALKAQKEEIARRLRDD